jgi:hypothetical protein
MLEVFRIRRRVSAIDRKDLAGGERGFVRGEEQGVVGYVLGDGRASLAHSRD